MSYQALKPIRFDRQYYIGEIIPEMVIDAGRVADLVAMGIVLHVAEPPADSTADTVDVPVDTDTATDTDTQVDGEPPADSTADTVDVPVDTDTATDVPTAGKNRRPRG